MVIGIFGGTFDPIHNGHIALAERILHQAKLDEVWFLVTPQNPWKKDRHLSPDDIRYEMVSKALADHSCLKASDYEFSLEKPSYTYQTLRRLREDFPQHEFVLIIGADNWAGFTKWAEPEEILNNHRLVVYPREGYALDAHNKPDTVLFADTELFPISSTEIRAMIKSDADISDIVPHAVLDYKNLYF